MAATKAFKATYTKAVRVPGLKPQVRTETVFFRASTPESAEDKAARKIGDLIRLKGFSLNKIEPVPERLKLRSN